MGKALLKKVMRFWPVFRPFFAGRLRFARDVVYEMPSSIPNSGGSDRVVTNGRYLPLEVFYTGEEKGFGVWCTERIQEVRKRSSFPPHLTLSSVCKISLPRQARDKHGENLRESSQKSSKTRANAFSPQGDFICEYVGEILAVEEAMARPDHSYQFELGITSKLLGAKNGLFF
jgi:hypothetical protein